MIISMPKQEIVEIIKRINIDGMNIEKYQKKPSSFTKLPAITYSQNQDSIKVGFGKQIQFENYGFQIDVWGNKSIEVSKIVNLLKKELILNNFKIINGQDLDDPSGLYRYILIIERRK